MADNTIEIRLVASDEGVAQALGNVDQALDKTQRKVQDVTSTTGGFEEMMGQHSTRAVHLLAGGIANELDPALGSLLGRINAATLGVRLLGEGLSLPMMIAIGTAVAGLTLFIGKINELATRQATLSLAVSALDTGPIIAQLTDLAKTFEMEEKRADSWAGTIINSFARAAREITNFQLPSALVPGFMDTLAGKIGIPGPTESIGALFGNKNAFEDPLVTRQKEALVAWDVTRPIAYKKELQELALTYDQIKAAQAAIPPPLFISQGLTLAQEATLQYGKMSAAVKQVAADNIALAQTQTMLMLAAMIKPLGGTETPQYQAFAGQQQVELSKRIVDIQETYKAQAMQLTNTMQAAMDPVYTALVSQARGVGFRIGEALGGDMKAKVMLDLGVLSVAFIRQLSDLQQMAAARSQALSMLALINPSAASTQQAILGQIQGARSAGINVPLPGIDIQGGTTGGLAFGEDTYTRFATQYQEQLAAIRLRIEEAFQRGGRPEQVKQTAIEGFTQQGLDLGMTITNAMYDGIKAGIDRSRAVAGAKLAAEGLGPGFEQTVKMMQIDLKDRMTRIGFGPQFAELASPVVAKQNVLTEAFGVAEQAMISKVLAGVTGETIDKIQKMYETGDYAGLLGSRLRRMIITEFSRAGFKGFTKETFQALVELSQSQESATISEKISAAPILTDAAITRAAAYDISYQAGKAQDIANSIKATMAAAGLSGIIPTAILTEMGNTDLLEKTFKDRQSALLVDMNAAFSKQISDLITSGNLSGAAAMTEVQKTANEYATMTGRQLSQAQQEGLLAGFKQAQQDKAIGIEIQTGGPRSFLQSVLGETETLRIEAEKLGISAADGFYTGLLAEARTQSKREGLLTEGLTAQMKADIATLTRIAGDFRKPIEEQAAAGLKAGMLDLTLQLGTVGDMAKKAVTDIGAGFQRALSDAIFNFATGKTDATSMTQVWTNLWQGLARISSDITSKLIEQLILQWLGYEQTLNGLRLIPGGGGLASWPGLFGGGSLASLFSGGGSSSIAGALGPAFAEGGIVSKPTISLVGESGPEAIIPLDQLSSKGSGSQGVTVITLMKEEDLQSVIAQEVAKGRQVVVSDVLGNIRGNGVLRRSIQGTGR